MYEFDTYISKIVNNLRTSNDKKIELAEEFKDHLELLKTEFINTGFSEDESTKRAIEKFGESEDIKKSLQKSLFNFRSKATILPGILITLVILIFCFLPISGFLIASQHYNPEAATSSLTITNSWLIFVCITLFIPVGYILPIALNRVFNILHSTIIFIVLGILVGVCSTLCLTNSLDIKLIVVSVVSGFLGGMVGYGILLLVNKLSLVRINEGKSSNRVKVID